MRRVPVRQVQWVILGITLLTFALLSRNELVALATVALAAFTVLTVVFALVFYPARIARFEESAVLPWPSEVVWDLIEPAEKAPLIDPGVVRGFHVEGTPSGLGEQQALERRDGSTVVLEVVEYEHGRRAVARVVSPPGHDRNRWIASVEPTSGGCVYTVALEVALTAGFRVRRRFVSAWRADAREAIARIEWVLDDTHPRDRTEAPGIDQPAPGSPTRQPLDDV